MKSVGIIGLGVMGLRCAQNLMKTGFSVRGFDPFAPAVERANKEGISSYPSVAEVARRSDVVILFVPTPADTEEVLLGEKGLHKGAGAGLIVINMSTVDPGTNERMAKALAPQGVVFVDAPVLGSPDGVGGWGFAVGGTDIDVASIQDILLSLSGSPSKIFHVGPVGSGSKLKLLNNMMLGAINACAAETLALAKKMNFSQKTLIDVAIAANARTLSSAYKEVATRAYEERYDNATFTVDMLLKDNYLCLEMAKQNDAPLVLGTAVDQINRLATSQGLGKEDHASSWKAVYASWQK